MTPKQLLGLSIDELEKLTDDELVRYLTPYIVITVGEKKVKQRVIDVEKVQEKAVKKKENLLDFAQRMEAMLKAQIAAKQN